MTTVFLLRAEEYPTDEYEVLSANSLITVAKEHGLVAIKTDVLTAIQFLRDKGFTVKPEVVREYT